MARMSRDRMTQTAIKILDKIASAEEINNFVDEAKAALDAEIDLIAEVTNLKQEVERLKTELGNHRSATQVAHSEKQQVEEGLVRAVAENDQLRKKADDIPRWLFPRFEEELPEDIKQELAQSGGEWVLAISPQADWMNWTTVAGTMLRWKLTTYRYPDGRTIVVGRKGPQDE